MRVIAFFIFASVILFAPLRVCAVASFSNGKKPFVSLKLFGYTLLRADINPEFDPVMPVKIAGALKRSGILKSADVELLSVEAAVGEDKAFAASLAAGALKWAASAVNCFAFGRKGGKLDVNVKFLPRKNEFYVELCGIICLTSADILTSLVRLLITTVFAEAEVS